MTISSFSKRHSPLYKLKVRYTSPTKEVLLEKEIEAPFTKWFSSNGIFHPEPFRQWLASEIDVLRLAANEARKNPSGLSRLEADRRTERNAAKGGKK
jgi:hypothetical protein